MTLSDSINRYRGIFIQLGIGVGKYAIAGIIDGTSFSDTPKNLADFENNLIPSILYFSALFDVSFAGIRGMINHIAKYAKDDHFFLNPRLPTCIEKIILYDTPKAIKEAALESRIQ